MPVKQALLGKISCSAQFLKTDIWRLRANQLTPRQSFWITSLRIFLVAIRGFNENKCDLRASALTFYSLLSIVPVVAMAFAIAKGFGVDKLFGEQLRTQLEGHEEVAERVLGFAQSLLANTKGGAIAGVGIVVLFWTVVKVLGHIETSFNDIWGVKTARSLGRKLADYLSVMMICPILVITASSLTVLLTTQVTVLVERLAFLGFLAHAIIWLLKLLPYCVIWIVFTFIYYSMPNTKVEIKSALWGGILAGTVYQLVQLAYITFQIGVSKYGAIYGSFAALPLFLGWLQLSWLIVLLGAEISFARQNVGAYEFEPDCASVSHSFKRIIALMIAHLCVKRFMGGEKALTAEEIARELESPIRLVRSVLFELTTTRLLSEVYLNGGTERAYQPACSIDNLTVAAVLERLDKSGLDTLPIADSEQLLKLREIAQRFQEMTEQSPANLKLRDL